MRFPRNAKLFAGRFDTAPFLVMLFLAFMFFVFQSSLVFTPGVTIQLPEAQGLAGAANPGVGVAMDAAGQLYYENQVIQEEALQTQLKSLVASAKGPLTLVIQADKGVTYDAIIRLSKLAIDAGFRETLLGTRPKVFPGAP